MSYIVTHPGQAHRDDFLACCLLLAARPDIDRIERREPAMDELAYSGVYCVDVGSQFDADLHNYDHHQYKGGDCAMVLVLKQLGIYPTAIKVYPWVEVTNDVDTLGPVAAAKKLGIKPPAFFATLSPVEEALLAWFGSLKEWTIRDALFKVMVAIGTRIIGHLNRYAERWVELMNTPMPLPTKKGVPILFASAEREPALALSDYANSIGAGITVCPDDRGPGWTLYRMNSTVAVDFTRINDDPRIAFAHAGGFIAKTAERCDRDAIFELLDKAIQ